MPDETALGAAGFPPTLWTQILQAQKGDAAACREALNQLLKVYWRPVYASIRFGWNRNVDEAQDLTQDFLADFIERKSWLDVDRSNGRFRSFIKAALKHFMLNEVRNQSRLKRGGGKGVVSIDQLENFDMAAYASGSPEEIMDQEWVATVLDRALTRLRQEFEKQGKARHFEVLKRYDLSEPRPTYSELAKDLGLGESDVRNYLHEARLRLKAVVKETVREYSTDEADLADETRFILG